MPEPHDSLAAFAAGKRVFVVGGGSFQLDIIRVAREIGLHVVVADGRGDAPGLDVADTALVIDTRAVDSIVDAARQYRVDAVVTAASDVAVTAVAAVTKALGLCGITPEVVRRGRDKLETYRVLTEAGLCMPHTLAVRDAAHARALLSEVGGYPCVIKPRSSAGGRGVTIVRNDDELPQAIADACAASHDGSGALLQAFAVGESVGVEAFFWEGELCRAFLMNDEYMEGFVSPSGHSVPCSLPAEKQHRLERQVAAWGKALGMSHGPANFDLRITARGTELIEANLRLGGNSITELMRAGFGVDLSRAALACALGLSPKSLLSFDHCVPTAACLILKRGHGRVLRRPDLAAMKANPDLLSLELSPLDEPPRVNQWSILGRAIMRGSDAEAAAAHARQLADAVASGVTLGGTK